MSNLLKTNPTVIAIAPQKDLKRMVDHRVIKGYIEEAVQHRNVAI
jgi:hypothetical protein